MQYFLCSWGQAWLETTPDSDTSSELLPQWTETSVEFRHPSRNDDHLFAMLEHHAVAYCVMSGRAPPMRAARDGAVRVGSPARTRPAPLYAGSYSNDDLGWWADRLHEWNTAGKNVFVNFNNTDTATQYATHAQALRQLLSA